MPDKGVGDWALYYYCPQCSVPLEFHRQEKTNHRCPRCGNIYRGNPFDGAWWSLIHNQNVDQSWKMGLLYQLTGDFSCFEKVRLLLLEYAKYYKGYEVHGEIPCNGPGKAKAQTLDDAVFLRTLAFAYDLVEEGLKEAERESILDGIFIPGAEFLIQHRGEQIHNHEVIINSAIAVIGLLLNKTEWTEAALYGKYGIQYQLEHGVLEDGMWFECAFSYHLYALNNFFMFEKFAKHTKYSLLYHPNYKKMVSCILRYIQEDGTLPLINDARPSHGGMEVYQVMEFANRELGVHGVDQLLKYMYAREDRGENLEAFLYGVDELKEESDDTKPRAIISRGGSGLTVLGSDENSRVVFRHGPYAGEHEHFDKLGISLQAYGIMVAGDLGTCGYGAPMHYQYYKNTGTHNTVVINEGNQPPVDARLVRAWEMDGNICLEAEADFTKAARHLDSYAPVLWNTQNYEDVILRRKLIWNERWLVEIFTVDAKEEKQIDWVMHFGGFALDEAQGSRVECFSKKTPFSFLNNMRSFSSQKIQASTYQYKNVNTRIHTFMGNHVLYQGTGPGNPSDTEINYLVERTYGSHALFCHVIESFIGKPKIIDIDLKSEGDELKLAITENDRESHLCIGGRNVAG